LCARLYHPFSPSRPFVIIATIEDIDEGKQVLAAYGDDYWNNHPVNGIRCASPDVVYVSDGESTEVGKNAQVGCMSTASKKTPRSRDVEETDRKGKRAKEMPQEANNAPKTPGEKRVEPANGLVGAGEELSADLHNVVEFLMGEPPAEQTQHSPSQSQCVSMPPSPRSLFTQTSPNARHADICASSSSPPASTSTPAAKRVKGSSAQTKGRPVHQVSLEGGQVICFHKSLTAAAWCANVRKSKMWHTIDRCKELGGYLWRYVDSQGGGFGGGVSVRGAEPSEVEDTESDSDDDSSRPPMHTFNTASSCGGLGEGGGGGAVDGGGGVDSPLYAGGAPSIVDELDAKPLFQPLAQHSHIIKQWLKEWKPDDPGTTETKRHAAT
jgi:hypothetical protein